METYISVWTVADTCDANGIRASVHTSRAKAKEAYQSARSLHLKHGCDFEVGVPMRTTVKVTLTIAPD